MQKIKKILLGIVLVIAVAFAGIEAIKFMNNKERQERIANGEFRFEDYDTAEEAKVELLKLYPVGSSVDDLIKTLKSAGDNTECYKTNSSSLVCSYRKSYFLLSLKTFGWFIVIDFDENLRAIRKIELSRKILKRTLVTPDVIPAVNPDDIMRKLPQENKTEIDHRNMDIKLVPTENLKTGY